MVAGTLSHNWTDDGTSVRCQCRHCFNSREQPEKLAEITHNGLEIMDGRHGRVHFVQMPVRSVIERLAGTTDGSAVVDYVRRVFV